MKSCPTLLKNSRTACQSVRHSEQHSCSPILMGSVLHCRAGILVVDATCLLQKGDAVVAMSYLLNPFEFGRNEEPIGVLIS